MSNKKIITWKQFRELVVQLEKKIEWNSNINDIYGIPRGGQYVALMLSEISGIPLTDHIDSRTFVVDDIADSGNTLARFHGKGCGVATLHVKPRSMVKPHYWVEETEDYIIYPYEAAANEDVEDNIRRILQFLGVYKVTDGQLLSLKHSVLKFVRDWGVINGKV